MVKGQFGLNLAAVAILTFVLGFFGFLEALVLLVAYALLIEKNPWLTRQALQALYLRLIYSIVVTVVGWAFTLLEKFFGLFKANAIVNGLYNINSFVNTLLYIFLFLLCALAVIRLLKEQDADIPLASNLADYTMGKISGLTPASTPVAPVAPVVPFAAAAAAYQAPAAPTPKPPSPFQAPATASGGDSAGEPAGESPAEKDKEPEDDAESEEAPAEAASDENWTCKTCGRENSGKFCMGCGNPRP